MKRRRSNTGEREREEERDLQRRIAESLARRDKETARRKRIVRLRNLYAKLQQEQSQTSEESEDERNIHQQTLDDLCNRERNRTNESSATKNLTVIRDSNNRIIAEGISVVTIRYLVPHEQTRGGTVKLEIELRDGKFEIQGRFVGPWEEEATSEDEDMEQGANVSSAELSEPEQLKLQPRVTLQPLETTGVAVGQ